MQKFLNLLFGTENLNKKCKDFQPLIRNKTFKEKYKSLSTFDSEQNL